MSEAGGSAQRERAFYRFDVRRWMELSRHRLTFSGAMFEIFKPAMRPETQAVFSALQGVVAKHFSLAPPGGSPGAPTPVTGPPTGASELPVIDGGSGARAIGAPSEERVDGEGAGLPDAQRGGDILQPPSEPETREETLLRLDEALAGLSPRDRDRLLCRAVARDIWGADETRSIASILRDPRVEGVTGRAWSGRDTLRNWIKDLDPRPSHAKPGPRAGSAEGGH